MKLLLWLLVLVSFSGCYYEGNVRRGYYNDFYEPPQVCRTTTLGHQSYTTCY